MKTKTQLILLSVLFMNVGQPSQANGLDLCSNSFSLIGLRPQRTVEEAATILKDKGVAFKHDIRDGRAVLRIGDLHKTQLEWPKIASRIKRNFGYEVEFDQFIDEETKLPIDAGTARKDHRIILNPNYGSGRFSVLGAIIHEKVHLATDRAFLSDPNSSRATWALTFEAGSGELIAPLPAQYRSLLRTDELLAYSRSVVFWRKILGWKMAGKIKSTSPIKDFETELNHLDQFSAKKMGPPIQALLEEALASMRISIFTGKALEIDGVEYFDSQISQKHFLVKIKIRRSNTDYFIISIPYFINRADVSGNQIDIYPSELLKTARKFEMELQRFLTMQNQ